MYFFSLQRATLYIIAIAEIKKKKRSNEISGFLQKIFLKLGYLMIKFGFCVFSTVSQKKNCYMVLSHDAFTVGMFNNCAIFFLQIPVMWLC